MNIIHSSCRLLYKDEIVRCLSSSEKEVTAPWSKALCHYTGYFKLFYFQTRNSKENFPFQAVSDKCYIKFSDVYKIFRK